MMVMTAKVDLKKIAAILAAAVVVIAALILFLGGGKADTQTAAKTSVTTNDDRIRFLKDFGWDVVSSPVQSGQVRIPDTMTEVYERYNSLQKSQGYDLSAYAGKNVMRYVYRINNLPGAAEPVYATLLIYKNQVIGGDITDSAPGGKIRSFRMPAETIPSETGGPSDTTP